MSEASIVELVGIEHRLGNFRLQVASLQIERGETLCLLGPTGAGKSTLLRLLSCLDPPTTGRILLDAQIVEPRSRPIHRVRRISSVPQRPLPLRGTVRYNVEYGLRIRQAEALSRRCNRILDRLGLMPIADQDARHLSGGQLQLVALARALVIEPEILLLDEPTAHLDPANVACAEAVIRDEQQRLEMTVVWASHNLFQARRVGTRTALLLNGSIVEIANALEFFENPADERTKQFVEGRMVY